MAWTRVYPEIFVGIHALNIKMPKRKRDFSSNDKLDEICNNKVSKRSDLVGDLKSTDIESSKDVVAISSFDLMGIKDDLLRGIYAYGKEIVTF